VFHVEGTALEYEETHSLPTHRECCGETCSKPPPWALSLSHTHSPLTLTHLSHSLTSYSLDPSSGVKKYTLTLSHSLTSHTHSPLTHWTLPLVSRSTLSLSHTHSPLTLTHLLLTGPFLWCQEVRNREILRGQGGEGGGQEDHEHGGVQHL
jgi:hypothetical protein